MSITRQQLLQILPSAGQLAGVFVPVINIAMHAQRIIGIANDGDQGLIALQAYQAYAKEVSSTQ